MIIGVGIDVVDVDRFRTLLDDEFRAVHFRPAEAAYCSGRARPWECYAARLAAKRALHRALGADVVAAPWLDIEVERGPAGEGDLLLTGRALATADAAGVTRRWVSLAHTESDALAVVVLESPDDRDA